MSSPMSRTVPFNLWALLGLIASLSFPPAGLVFSIMGLQRSYFLGGRGRLMALFGVWISVGWIMIAVFLGWVFIFNDSLPNF